MYDLLDVEGYTLVRGTVGALTGKLRRRICQEEVPPGIPASPKRLVTSRLKIITAKTKDKGGPLPQQTKVVGSDPSSNEGLSIGLEGVHQLNTVGQNMHADNCSSQPIEGYTTDQRHKCPYCPREMLGKNINRHLSSSCPGAPKGAFVSFRSTREKQVHSHAMSTKERVSCPHCHNTFANTGNLNRHLLICKQKKHNAGSLQSDRVPCQTARQQGQPADQHSPHSVSSPAPIGLNGPSGRGMDVPNPDYAHSATSNPTQEIPSLVRKSKLLFPPSGSKDGKEKWAEINRQVKRELPSAFPGGVGSWDPDKAVDRLHQVIRSYFSDPPIINPRSGHPRKRRVVPEGLRKRQRDLRREWHRRESTPGADEGALRAEYNALRREVRRRVKLAALQADLIQHGKNVQAFRKDPYKFAKKLFSADQQLEPEFGKEVADSHFSSVYTDEDRGHHFEDPDILPPAPFPGSIFNDAPPSVQEIQNVLRKSRNGSTPGPSGIPYVAYKNLPCLVAAIRRIFERVWRSKQVPLAWRVANMILLAKSGDSSHPANMRNIALGNTEGKLFFAIVAQRVQKHMIQNGYFDGVTQKGFMPGVSGCVEHSAVLREALGDARSGSKSICITWVDFANAFGSVKHSLIQYALRRYHFPASFRRLIFGYYDHMYANVQCSAFSSNPFHYGIGMFQGCTTSPVLFNTVMQILLDILKCDSNLHHAYEFQAVGDAVPKSVIAPTFADDLAVVTKSADGCQHLLNQGERFCTWTRTMQFKPPKCLAIAYKTFTGASSRFVPRDNKKWTAYDPLLSVNGHRLQVVGDHGFKYLGWLLEVDLSERCLKGQIQDKLRGWMNAVDSCHIDGVMKCWIYNFVIISKLSWSFTVGGLSVSFARDLHSMVLPYLKRWCGIPKRGANTAILFCGSQNHLGLSLRRTYSVYKAMQVVRRGILKRSKDPVVRHVYYMELSRQSQWSGPRFAAALELAAVEAQATDVVVSGQRAGLGFHRPSTCDENRITALKAFTEQDSKAQLEHASRLVVQGKIRSFDSELRRDWQWEHLLSGCTSSMFRFRINSTNDTLPTGANLSRWTSESVQVKCGGCSSMCPTLKHILNGCPSFLRQGRYTWRHNRVLEDIVSGIQKKLSDVASHQRAIQLVMPFISFVREGQSRLSHGHQAPTNICRPLCTGILDKASDWCILADGLTPRYRFPEELAVTNLRPDIVVYSASARVCVLVELTVPMEDRVLQSAVLKTEKYANLCRQIHSNSWECSLYTVEVGSRGNYTASLALCLKALGLSTNERKSVQRQAAATAQKCSYYIYLKRMERDWDGPM